MFGGVTRHMLPHLPGVPHLHVNRPLEVKNMCKSNIIWHFICTVTQTALVSKVIFTCVYE